MMRIRQKKKSSKMLIASILALVTIFIGGFLLFSNKSSDNILEKATEHIIKKGYVVSADEKNIYKTDLSN